MFVCLTFCLCVDNKLNYLRPYWGDWPEILHEGRFWYTGLNSSPSYKSVTHTPRGREYSISGFQPPTPSIYMPVGQNISVKPPIFDRCTLTSGDVAIFSCMLCHSFPTLGGRFGRKFKKFQKFLFNLNISNNIYVNLNCLIRTMFY